MESPETAASSRGVVHCRAEDSARAAILCRAGFKKRATCADVTDFGSCQEAIKASPPPAIVMRGFYKGQGATEYLVLLAVVLIVALVSVALLGFFPGMASDAQITQSKMYWSSASPISIVESGARAYSLGGDTYLYLRLRNLTSPSEPC